MTPDQKRGYTLTSGRHLAAYGLVIGLGPDLCAREGWDGDLAEHDEPLTPAERQEVADYMISLWQTWATL